MAPKAEKKPAKKVAKTAKTGGKKKSKAKVESFKIYIYKVLKQVRDWSIARKQILASCCEHVLLNLQSIVEFSLVLIEGRQPAVSILAYA